MWGLPYRTHSVLLAPLCDMFPLEYELMYRTGVLIRKCLDNEDKIVSNVTRNGIFFQHIKSPIGRNAGQILLGILFIRCQLSIKNSCFSECMTSCLLRYSNESVCSENCFVCVMDIAPRLCLAWTKWILLYNFYACSNAYILFFFILLLCTYV